VAGRSGISGSFLPQRLRSRWEFFWTAAPCLPNSATSRRTNVADDFLIPPIGKVDSPGSCIRLSSGEQFLSDKLLLRARRRSFGGEKQVAWGKNRGCSTATPYPGITSLPRVALCGRCGGSDGEQRGLGAGGGGRGGGGTGWRRRSINIKLSVQHLPTSVATRATTRPASVAAE